MSLAHVTLLALLITVALGSIPLHDRIKHVIVVMEENRAFDHIFGWYPGVNGLTGKEFNLVNSSRPKSKRIYVSDDAPYINECDPDHSLPATTRKIFGFNATKHNNFSTPTMEGFVEVQWKVDHEGKKFKYCGVMDGFAPEKLPIITTLASEYALFDRFFAALPGPTWPNRLFFMMATSAGLTETGPWYRDVLGQLFPQKTIFDQVEEVGGSWKLYYNDTPWELFVETLALHPENAHTLDVLFSDARDGTLPDFAFINPRAGINMTLGVGSNDEHPDHDMAVGEAFLKDIYEALRASPQWNETLFVITFDEHGGFYDHVPTPLNVPPPGDGETSYPDANFTFDRLGIRIPTLLISPWLPKGLVVSDAPPPQKPFNNSEYDLTSIIASTRKILGILNGTGPLTKRDAWSSTFEHTLMMLSAPRTDCPMHLPAPPPPTLSTAHEAQLPVNGLQQEIMAVHAHLSGVPYPHHVRRQEHVSLWLQERFREHHNRTQRWKRSKLSEHYELVAQPFAEKVLSQHWTVNVNVTKPFSTISTTLDNASYCLDAGVLSANESLTVSLCYPSLQPQLNSDRAQQWVLENDATVRPFWNVSLCMTTAYFAGRLTPFLDTCIADMREQHWAYTGVAPGSPDASITAILFAMNGLAVIRKNSSLL